MAWYHTGMMEPHNAADRPTERPACVDVIVIGGGISGLSTAYYLQAPAGGPPPDVLVIERAPRPGGKLVSETRDGFVIEGGPDSFITAKLDAYDLCRELGLAPALIGTNDARRQTYVLAGGRLQRLPAGLLLIVPARLGPLLGSSLLSARGKLRLAADLLLPRRREAGDESLAAFVRRRLGAEAVARLATPLLAGIYVGDPAHLSLEATFPRLRELEREHRSLILGARRALGVAVAGRPASTFMSLRGGLEDLVRALVAQLGPARLWNGVAVSAVARTGDPAYPYRVALGDGGAVLARRVVLAIPAGAAAGLLAPLLPELATELRALHTLASATVSLGYRAADLDRPLDGFGFVVAAQEPTRLLACTWTSTKFDGRAPPGHVLLRAFVGGARHEALVALPDAALLALVRAELARIMGLRATPVIARIYRWPGGNPQYEVGHLARVARLEALAATLPGLYLTGSPYRGVGIPDCIRQGRATAERVRASLATTAPG